MNNCNCTQSAKPLKFMVDAVTADRKVCFVHPDSVDISTELRGQPTNLNYYKRQQTVLFGTAPFMGRGHGQFVDQETNLRDGNKMSECNKILSEIQYDTNDNAFLKCDMKIDTMLRPQSTRVNLRNMYASEPSKRS
jgi:hypothetical protein